jgi:hypothetical protein
MSRLSWSLTPFVRRLLSSWFVVSRPSNLSLFLRTLP